MIDPNREEGDILCRTYPKVPVNDGILDIRFLGIKGQPGVSAIQVQVE